MFANCNDALFWTISLFLWYSNYLLLSCSYSIVILFSTNIIISSSFLLSINDKLFFFRKMTATILQIFSSLFICFVKLYKVISFNVIETFTFLYILEELWFVKQCLCGKVRNICLIPTRSFFLEPFVASDGR